MLKETPITNTGDKSIKTDHNLVKLMYLLRVNKENSNSQAVHIKVSKAHFSGSNISTQVFAAMESNILPIAITCTGQRWWR
jgi:hypothetical protein